MDTWSVSGRAISTPKPVRQATPPAWQSAEVVEVVDEAPDAVTLRLALEVVSDFLPGQYYNVRLPIPGRSRPVQRAYSVGSSPRPAAPIIDLGIREVPGGLVSPRLVRDFLAGTRLEVRGPTGRFTWTERDGGPVLLLGAGSGLVPLVSIIRYAAASGAAVPMCLLSSAASFDYALYRNDLASLVAVNNWLRVVHTFTRDLVDHRAAFHRRIDRAMLAEVLAGELPGRAYLCGPPAMVEDAAHWLSELGLDARRIHTEKYE